MFPFCQFLKLFWGEEAVGFVFVWWQGYYIIFFFFFGGGGGGDQ